MSILLYWLAIRSYVLAVRIAALFNPKARLFVQGRRQLLSRIRYALVNERRPRIWMHCASLGEFEQGRPLLEKLKQKYSQHAVILTFFSPSGYEVRKDYEGADYVFYLPVDSARNARRFIDTVQPSLCVFVKYELWYFYLSRIASKDIPLILVSAIFRKSQPFFQWYGGLHQRMLQCFTHIFVQDDASEKLLQNIDVEHVSVAGDTRFDRVLTGRAEGNPIPQIADFCQGYKVMVAGSTWPDDERLLHQAFKSLSENWKLILVPHEVDEGHIGNILQLFGDKAVRWSAYSEDAGSRQVLVVDTIGMLLNLYIYADVAWVGGGMGRTGVHNVLEAAVYAIPVLHGPVYEQYLEAKELLSAGGSVIIEKADMLLHQLAQWQRDIPAYEQACEAAGQYVLSKTGASDKVIARIEREHWLTNYS